MSDDMNDVGSMEGSESLGAETGKKSGPLPEFLILILKIVAAAIGLILLSAVVSYFVFTFIAGEGAIQTQVDYSENYSTKPPILLWWAAGEIRAQTRDTPSKSVILEIQMGYDPANQKILTELNSRRAQITDMIRGYIAQQRNDDLLREVELKEAFRTRVNQMLSEGQIQEVVFINFTTFEL